MVMFVDEESRCDLEWNDEHSRVETGVGFDSANLPAQHLLLGVPRVAFLRRGTDSAEIPTWSVRCDCCAVVRS